MVEIAERCMRTTSSRWGTNMEFEPGEVYVIGFPKESSAEGSIAVGVRTFDGSTSGSGVNFWLTSGNYPYKHLRGHIINSKPGLIEFMTESGLILDFEPLSLKRWRLMGDSGNILRYELIKDKLSDEDDLKKFYNDEFLPDSHSADIHFGGANPVDTGDGDAGEDAATE